MREGLSDDGTPRGRAEKAALVDFRDSIPASEYDSDCRGSTKNHKDAKLAGNGSAESQLLDAADDRGRRGADRRLPRCLQASSTLCGLGSAPALDSTSTSCPRTMTQTREIKRLGSVPPCPSVSTTRF